MVEYRNGNIDKTVFAVRSKLCCQLNISTVWNTLMNTEPPIAIEIDCETGVETVRPLTDQEITQRNADVARNEAERQAKEQQDALERAERNALAAWIAGHPDLPEAARNALARATGVSTVPGVTPGIGVPNG